jgi:hypothetical protein
MAVDLHSSTPTQSGLTPLEIFIGSKGSINTELPSFWLSYHCTLAFPSSEPLNV